MTAETSSQTYDRAAVQRRTTAVAMSAVVPTTAAMGASFAASAVLAEDITGSVILATLAAGSMSIGSMVAAVPLSRRMARLGRRSGLV
ncbi:MAG: MFS transporter, partial [Acidimicrobiaceae bacterium]|nr:MFS transporter [Acidimicrobiaceae bacterium]